LGGVVQEGGDRFVLAPAVVEHDRRDAEQVPDVGGAVALPLLTAVELVGVLEGVVEPRGELGHGGGASPAILRNWRGSFKRSRVPCVRTRVAAWLVAALLLPGGCAPHARPDTPES